jgi:uncharacterized protein (TIGR00266 family)
MNKIAFEIEHQPAYASLILNLQANQTAIVEAGAMAAMDANIQMKSKMKGGLMQSLGRMLAGESLFLSEFTAVGKPGQLYLSPGVPGDVQHYYLDGGRNSLIVQSGGFVAASPGVTLNTQFQGAKGFFSGESLFMIQASGQGDIWFSSYGAILEIPVENEFVVDTGYIVAFEDSLNFSVEMISGLSMRGLGIAVFGGEGLVCRFRGTGRLWVQSRELYNLINFLNPFRPTSSSND